MATQKAGKKASETPKAETKVLDAKTFNARLKNVTPFSLRQVRGPHLVASELPKGDYYKQMTYIDNGSHIRLGIHAMSLGIPVDELMRRLVWHYLEIVDNV